MSERLFRGSFYFTPRMRKPRYADEGLCEKIWIPEKTFNFFWESSDNLILVRMLKNPELYPDLQFSTKKHFFDDTEHWEMNLHYHISDEDLLNKLDAGESVCEVCNQADAVLIDGITDLETNVKKEYAMCAACFDKFADMSNADSKPTTSAH